MLPSQRQRASAPPSRARRGRRIGWLRRRVLPVVGKLGAWSALLSLTAWGVGIAFNDGAIWSQFLWWIPTGLACIAAWIGLSVSKLSEMLGVRLAGASVRPLALLGAVLATGYLVFVELRVHRFAFPAGGEHIAGSASLRVVYWNVAWTAPTGSAAWLDEIGADVAIIANPYPGSATNELFAAMRERAISWDERDGDRAQTHLVRVRQKTVISRWPIAESRASAFGSEVDTDEGNRLSRATQTGVSLVRLDLDGRPLVLWVVDMPSNPMISRPSMMERAAAITADYPSADLIIGDFNTPSGSASIRRFVGDRTNVRDAVGRGRSATWPRPLSVMQIDLAFVSEALAPISIATSDTPTGLHRAIVVDLALPRPDGPDPRSQTEPAAASSVSAD